jgi:hypothetical protein
VSELFEVKVVLMSRMFCRECGHERICMHPPPPSIAGSWVERTERPLDKLLQLLHLHELIDFRVEVEVYLQETAEVSCLFLPLLNTTPMFPPTQTHTGTHSRASMHPLTCQHAPTHPSAPHHSSFAWE